MAARKGDEDPLNDSTSEMTSRSKQRKEDDVTYSDAEGDDRSPPPVKNETVAPLPAGRSSTPPKARTGSSSSLHAAAPSSSGGGYKPPEPANRTEEHKNSGNGSSAAAATAINVPAAKPAPAATSAAATAKPTVVAPASAAAQRSQTLAAGDGVQSRERAPDVLGLIHVPEWIRLHPLLGAYMAEALGTFAFVLTIALVEVNNPIIAERLDTNVSPLPIGFMLMCMILTFGYVSGGHLNPAVSFAIFLYERKAPFKTIGYMLAQCGASLGAGIVAMIVQGTTEISTPDVHNNATYIRKGFFAELIYTFALALVVLNVVHTKKEASVFFAMSVGMVVVAGASAVGGVSGGAFNPAVATGLQFAVCFTGNCTPVLHFWMYWLAPLAGAGLASVIFANLYKPEPEL